jgi:putative transposase
MLPKEQSEEVMGEAVGKTEASLGEREKSVTERARLLAELSEEERKSAYERFELLRPCLEDGVSQAEIARREQISLKNIQRWIKQYREEGLVGLARRRRKDSGKRRGIPVECVQLIEGLALQRPRRSAAAIHRQVEAIAKSQGWPSLSYGRVYAIIASLDPELVVLAHEGSRVYQEKYDVLFLHEVSRPNERWQADHCWLNIWLVNEKGQPARPYLTVILDEYSRAVMGYRLSFEPPSAYQTGLALRLAICGKDDARWPACGIPDVFYSDHGSDFTSKKLEQVAAHLSMKLIFSQKGRPRGRGKIERFFRSVREMLLPGLRGYIPRVKRNYRSARKRQRLKTAMVGKTDHQASLTLAEFDALFRTWVLDTYHHRRPRRLKGQPLSLWQQGRWLPRQPKSQAELDLLLLREGKSRQVHQEGIFFHGYRYMDTALAGYVGTGVVIYYDPLDLTRVSVYVKEAGSEGERYLCLARCQELGDEPVSLKELVAARNAQRKQLHARLDERKHAVKQAGGPTQAGVPVSDEPSERRSASVSRLKPPAFMTRISAEFLPEEEVSA